MTEEIIFKDSKILSDSSILQEANFKTFLNLNADDVAKLVFNDEDKYKFAIPTGKKGVAIVRVQIKIQDAESNVLI